MKLPGVGGVIASCVASEDAVFLFARGVGAGFVRGAGCRGLWLARLCISYPLLFKPLRSFMIPQYLKVQQTKLELAGTGSFNPNTLEAEAGGAF